MAAILGLKGYNKSSGTNKLIAAYGADFIDVDTGTGATQQLQPYAYVGGQDVEFEVFMDYLFPQNGQDTPVSYDGTNWGNTNTVNCPIAKYIKEFNERLYLGLVTYGGSTWRSRVFYSDLPKNNKIEWGLETGSDLAQTAGSAVITSASAAFQSRGVKTGDPFLITNGTNAGQYEVSSIDSETQITLTENLTYTATNSSYWVGSNWFDVRTDNNDYLRGFGENSDRLLIFKLLSLFRYDGANLRVVTGAVGTNTQRSVINVGDYTFYFHGSETTKTGIYRYDGTDSIKISGAIQPYIDGIAASSFPNVVAWRQGNWYRCFVGNITNSPRNISLTKVVLSYHISDNKWSIDPINETPKCASSWIESNAEKIFFGDDSDAVFQIGTGNNFAGKEIPWTIETGVKYPLGSEAILRFTRIQIISRDANGVAVRYKLYNKSGGDNDDSWIGLGDIEKDKTELIIPTSHNRASGINLRLDEMGLRANRQFIEKITIFYQLEGIENI